MSIRSWIADRRAEIQRGKKVTEQMKAEKARKKIKRAKYLEPGTFRYGLHYRQGVGGFMKDVKERRKQKRELEDSKN